MLDVSSAYGSTNSSATTKARVARCGEGRGEETKVEEEGDDNDNNFRDNANNIDDIDRNNCNQEENRTRQTNDDAGAAVSTPVSELQQQNQQGGTDTSDEQASSAASVQNSKPLYKSSRFKGYLTLVLGSGVNFQAAYVSGTASSLIGGDVVVQPATPQQRSYAMAVALISVILSAFILGAHLDGITPLKHYWKQWLFRPQSRFEMLLIVFLGIWWIVALWLNTGMRGIAGDGKGQYNLYFSTWICFFVCAWTLERWMVSCGYPSLEGFLASWPNRAPGWIAIMFCSLAALLSVLDLYVNWSKAHDRVQEQYFLGIPQSQWEWLLFVTAFTIAPAIGFILVEIFRETKPGLDKNTKPEWETILEGCFFLMLTIIWIPSVIIATTPGGAASNVGNSYFFVWLTTVFVIDSSVWWIHDWRRRVLTEIQQQEKEYRNIQRQVQQRSRAEAEEAAAALAEESRNARIHRKRGDTDHSGDGDDDDDDDLSIVSSVDSMEGQAIPRVAGT